MTYTIADLAAVLSADTVAGNAAFGSLMPKFKVGAPVWLVADWDNKGTVYARACVIKACGAKRIHLLDATSGEPIEHRLYTDTVNQQAYSYRLYARTASFTEQGRMLALAVATQILAYQNAHFHQRIAQWGNEPGFRAAMVRGLSELHEPRAMQWAYF